MKQRQTMTMEEWIEYETANLRKALQEKHEKETQTLWNKNFKGKVNEQKGKNSTS